MKITKLTPMLNRVLVKKFKNPTSTRSGIILPSSSTNTNTFGTVVSLGKFSKEENKVLKVGDKVLIPEYGGIDVPFGEEKSHLILNIEDIQAKVE